jgi:Uma2 family endonuclease
MRAMLGSMVDPARRDGRGPFRADQLRDGDRYELSEGHALYCHPGGGDHARTEFLLPVILGTDPDVEDAGLEVGHQLTDDTLRAPDVSIGNVPAGPGWVRGAPTLAVEIAGVGQDEADLAKKTAELLEHGARFVWVVRLTGPRRVEVHRPGQPMVLLRPGEVLEAPGVLRNPVPVDALFDAGVADRVALRNLLQRHGHDSLESVREAGKVEGKAEGKAEGKVEGKVEGKAEGKAEGMAEMLWRLISKRFGAVPAELDAKLREATDAEIDDLADRLLAAGSVDELFAPIPTIK